MVDLTSDLGAAAAGSGIERPQVPLLDDLVVDDIDGATSRWASLTGGLTSSDDTLEADK